MRRWSGPSAVKNDPEQAAGQLAQLEQDWNELAALDPYWAILTTSGKRFGRWDHDEFFATGTAEAAALVDRIEELGHPLNRERALDFGCGLGRLTRALGQHFAQCVGVDISENMVLRARELNADVRGVSFVVNRAGDLGLFADGSFDLIYTTIVLQHIPDRRTIEGYIAEFCRLLRPGGLAVFQLPSHIPAVHRLQLRRRLYSGFATPRVQRPVRISPPAVAAHGDELYP